MKIARKVLISGDDSSHKVGEVGRGFNSFFYSSLTFIDLLCLKT